MTRPALPIAETDPQEYYDERYTQGYADGWEPQRYVRIRNLIRGLELSVHGRALDFGCGRGAMCQVLKEALPGWEIVGAELSEVALHDAAQAVPGVRFLHVSKLRDEEEGFDLIFSHHVLEHVPRLEETLRNLADMTRPAGGLFHVLPCGNAGSLEHRLATVRRDGIDVTKEGRFYCDDEPHLRRLTSEQLRRVVEAMGFTFQRAWFGDHNWGARRAYAQKTLRQLWSLTDLRQATNVSSALSLLWHRAALLAAALACKPTYYRWQVDHRHRCGQPWTAAERFCVPLSLALSPVSTPAVRLMTYLASREWDLRSSETSGQEMYLYFRRSA